MDDLISRRAAIDALINSTIYSREELKKLYEEGSHRDCWVNGICEAIETLKELPTTESEIIRCGECKWYFNQDGSTAEWLPCMAAEHLPPSWFCGNAERREDG